MKQRNNLVDRLGDGSRVACGSAVTMAQQKSHMADDAVAHRTEAGQPNK